MIRTSKYHPLPPPSLPIPSSTTTTMKQSRYQQHRFPHERKKRKWYHIIWTIRKIYLPFIIVTGVLLLGQTFRWPLDVDVSRTASYEKMPPLVSYDLDVFIPINNSSMTFTLDNFQFSLLQYREGNHAKAIQWKMPNVSEPANYIPTSMLQNFQGNDTRICQIVCRFDRRSFGYTHFPHFLQQALPCYNIFHYFTKTMNRDRQRGEFNVPLRNYMVLPEWNGNSPNQFSPYIQHFIKAMEGSPYYVHMIYGFNESIPVHKDCSDESMQQHQKEKEENGVSLSSSSSSSSSALLAVKSFSDTGWDHPCRYFLSPPSTFEAFDDVSQSQQQQQQQQQSYDNYELLQQIQHSVLGDDHFRTGPSSFDHDDHYRRPNIPPTTTTTSEQRIVQILILDRKSSSRDFAHANDVILALQNYLYNYSSSSSNNRNNWTATVASTTLFRMNVTYIPSFNKYTLYEQAYLMHHTDIIYSPHGAQLSNLMYIRPCTVSVEFFPQAYYMQFFQSLAASAHGISFEGYPSATMNSTDKVTDSQVTARHKELREAARNSRINVGPDFFIQTLPQLMNATIQCRANYYRKNSFR